ncbi:hypothetical protein BKA83DRAFT_4489875 [Pisolithus microcarpus]|nr:hypothetical protein BKA83DRAFT_4489875 [Pisolithus microcarpus]
MSIRHPRDYTPVLSDTEAPVSIDWTTVTDEALEPSPTDSFEVELAKIDERAQRMKVRAHLRRREQEEERLRKQKEEEKRRREEEEERQRRELEERRRLAEDEARRQREMEADERAKVLKYNL